MDIFAPYLSEALRHKIEDARACSADWDRQNPEPKLKAEMASSYGPFSGDGAEAQPQKFHIEKARSMKDSSLRVYVALAGGKPPNPWTWRVAALVQRENDRYVVDDVIYVNDSVYSNPKEKPTDRRLSEYLSAGCDGRSWAGPTLPTDPLALVRSLYQQVVAHPPAGIPSGIDWKIFAPFMSKRLLHKIDLFDACAADWDRRHQDPMNPEKAPFGVYESGIFSGGDERTEPRTFQIERTQSEKYGAVRVQVRLTLGTPHTNSWWVWHVSAIVVPESGRTVVDDVIYLKERANDHDYRLLEVLSIGCDGRRWVGYREPKSDKKSKN